MKTLTLPNTPMCKVVYTRGGTQYGAMMRTPADLDDVRIAMQSKTPPVPSKDIVRIEPVTPLAPINRPHPALHRLVKYAAITSCILVMVGCASAPKAKAVELPAQLERDYSNIV